MMVIETIVWSVDANEIIQKQYHSSNLSNLLSVLRDDLKPEMLVLKILVSLEYGLGDAKWVADVFYKEEKE